MMGSRQRGRGAAAALLMVVSLLASAAPVVADTGSTPSTVDPILSSMEPQPVGRTATLTVGLEENGILADGGTVTFYRLDGATEIAMGSAPITNQGGPSASIDLPSDLGVGAYEVFARFSGNVTYAPSDSEHTTIHVGPRPTNTILQLLSGADLAALEPGTTFTAKWDVYDPGFLITPLPDSGTVSLKIDGVEKASGSMHDQHLFDAASFAVGTHTVEADYTGDADFADSVSTGTFTFTVLPNIVHVTGVGLDLGTFYPRHDGYRDVVHAVGDRLEPASVTVSIFNSAGHKVRTLTAPSAEGPYSIAWNGRTSAGTLLPAGRYKVVQVVKDAQGKTLSVTRYVALSHKILITKTGYVTKLGKSLTVSGHTGGGTVTKVASGPVRLKAGSTVPGYAFGGWQFTLPSAISYSKLTLQVNDTAPLVSGPNSFGLQDFSSCPYVAGAPWDLACVAPLTAIGKGSRAWQSLTGYPNAGTSFVNRSGRFVRAIVVMNYSTAIVYTIRVKVTYRVLH